MTRKLNIPPKKLVESKLLIYILGVLNGDGYIDKNNQRVDLGVTDKDFALTFKKVLEDWSGLKVKMKFYNYEYRVILDSKIVVTFLKKYDAINKVERVIIKVNGEKEFLQGQYDSEGSVGDKEIEICNNNKQLLLLDKKLLKRLDVENGKISIKVRKGALIKFPGQKTYFTNFDNHEFNINGKQNLIKFKDLIGFNIKRKQDKLIKEINSYKKKMNNKVY